MTTLSATTASDQRSPDPTQASLWAVATTLTDAQIQQLREHVLRQLHHAGEEVRA